MTLEDETGHVNSVIWPDLGDRQRKTLLRSRLLSIVGKVQREGKIIHIIAASFEDYTALLGRLRTESRDFR